MYRREVNSLCAMDASRLYDLILREPGLKTAAFFYMKQTSKNSSPKQKKYI
jgi:hypothetical protein